MNNDNHQTGGPLFLTVDAILSEHEHLLAARSDPEALVQIRSFVERLTKSGAYFDEAFERKAIQGTLDYWTSELAKHQADEDLTSQRRRSIDEFNAQALKALQQDVENPFGRISDLMDSLSQEDRRSAAAILGLVSDTAKTQNLRFQENLLKEMVSQVTGESGKDMVTQVTRDREDATLLEFCLWHLFEDPHTRSGNKIYHPKKSGSKTERVDFFSCKVYLVRKADELFEALGRPAAVLDALTGMASGNANAQRRRSILGSIAGKLTDLGQAVKAWLRSASLRTRKFRVYDKKALNLLEFLQTSRLAFNQGGRWRMVHPALARWDPLKERRWKTAQKQRLLFLGSTAVVVAVLTSLLWIGWYKFWTNLAMAHLAKAQIYSVPKDRLKESVAGLWAAKLSMGSDHSYASQVGNDVIGAVIGDRAQNGKGSLGDLKPYPNVPRIECGQIPAFGPGSIYSVTAPDLAGPAKSSSSDACPVFAVNLGGTRLAAAWEKAGRVTMKVFEIPTNFRLGSGDKGALVEADLKGENEAAPQLKELPELELEPPLNRESEKLTTECKDRALRFSEDDKTVSFECLYSTGPAGERVSTVQWIPAAIKDRAANTAFKASDTAFESIKELVTAAGNPPQPCNKDVAESLPPTRRVTAVFLGPRTGSSTGFVTVRGDGHVQIWHDEKPPPCLSAQFRSDFVRVGTGGRPAALDVQDVAVPNPMYAIYALSPAPVIRVYEQRQAKHATLLMEHYPPVGVGTPVGIKFTKQARCLQIRAKRKHVGELVFVDYYLILDPNRLLAVADALKGDLDRETSTTHATLPAYDAAITKQCESA
jgi:hypothetical protein